MRVDYRSFIQDNFFIKNKQGVLVPFIFNDVQNMRYDQLVETYGLELTGIRENDLKGRQFGISSMIEGIFATDFILSELGELPIIDSDVYAHKDKETEAHIARFNLFLDSWMIIDQGGNINDMELADERNRLRREFLKVDNGGEIISKQRGAQYHAQTANAKVSGRGGTKQNIHWTEPAFYPNTSILNAKDLMVGAEKQVPDNYGKIFRESTGRSKGDYFAEEYYKGKEGRGPFKSRFIAWYLHKEYSSPAPRDWIVPEYYTKILAKGLVTVDQCYWHWNKTDQLTDKLELREYPTYDFEAFIAGGNPFFDKDTLTYYQNQIMKPIKESLYVTAL